MKSCLQYYKIFSGLQETHQLNKLVCLTEANIFNLRSDDDLSGVNTSIKTVDIVAITSCGDSKG